MPFFGAIDQLRRIENRKRNPLNRCCLMNGRLIVFYFSTATSTDDRDAAQLLFLQLLWNVLRNLSPCRLLARVFPRRGQFAQEIDESRGGAGECPVPAVGQPQSEEHTSELQSRQYLV